MRLYIPKPGLAIDGITWTGDTTVDVYDTYWQERLIAAGASEVPDSASTEVQEALRVAQQTAEVAHANTDAARHAIQQATNIPRADATRIAREVTAKQEAAQQHPGTPAHTPGTETIGGVTREGEAVSRETAPETEPHEVKLPRTASTEPGPAKGKR